MAGMWSWTDDQWDKYVESTGRPGDGDLCVDCGCCRYAHFIGSGNRNGDGECMIRAHKCTKPVYKTGRV